MAFSKTRPRRSLVALICFCLSLSMIGCGQQPSTGGQQGSKYGGVAVFRLAQEASPLSHIHRSNPVTGLVGLFARDSLVTRDPKTAEPVPELATGWTVSPDGLVWTFDLRKGVKWHDGQPFTADDVVFTYQLVLNEEVAAWARDRQFISGKPIRWEKVNDYQVRMILPEKCATIWDALVDPVPKHILEKIPPKDIEKSAWAEMPVLTGPFKVTEYKRGEYLRLARFDQYWGGKPYLDEVVIRILPDDGAAVVALESGQIDFLDTTAKDFLRLKETGKFKTYEQLSGNVQYLCMNCARWPFTDKNVRKAINHLVDRAAIVKQVVKGLGTPASCCITPIDMFYNDKVQVKYEYNVEKAQQLLAQAGFKPGPDGILEKDGKDLEFECLYKTGSTTDEEVWLIAQASFAKVGIKATIRALDQSVLGSLSVSSKEFPKPYQIRGLMGHKMGPDPDSVAFIYLRSRAGNWVALDSPRLDELFNKGRTETDIVKRRAIYEEIQQIITDEAPVVWVYYAHQLIVMSNKLVTDEAQFTLWGGYFRYAEKLYVKK